MRCKHLFGGLILAGVFLVYGVVATPVAAQCATCGVPAVSYTTAYAPAPVVYQSYRPRTGWYPGALLDRWRMNRWGANRTYTTAYAPTSATAYTAAYTPTYPPSYYATSYSAAYRPAYPVNYSVGYAPTVAYSPVTSCATCCADPCACSARTVVMRAIVDGCAGCGSGSYVGQAVYESPSTGCVGCAPGSMYVAPSTPPNGASQPPAIPPGADVSEQRVEKPTEASPPSEKSLLLDSSEQAEEADTTNGESEDPSAPSTMFKAPELFNPGDRMTQRSEVPVWTAVYHNRDSIRHQSARPIAKSASARPTTADVERDAQGWTSAGK